MSIGETCTAATSLQNKIALTNTKNTFSVSFTDSGDNQVRFFSFLLFTFYFQSHLVMIYTLIKITLYNNIMTFYV